jgi:hypothetical protein
VEKLNFSQCAIMHSKKYYKEGGREQELLDKSGKESFDNLMKEKVEQFPLR